MNYSHSSFRFSQFCLLFSDSIYSFLFLITKEKKNQMNLKEGSEKRHLKDTQKKRLCQEREDFGEYFERMNSCFNRNRYGGEGLWRCLGLDVGGEFAFVPISTR